MFVIGNLILMIEPYFLGKFFNVIQEGGENIVRNSAIYLGLIVLSGFLFWLFHGPARVMERTLSFQMTKNFANKLFRIITKLPLKWHKDHHSGDTIDKINKATHALRDFTEDGYVYIESIISVIASVVAILFIMGWDGALIFLFGALVFFIIFKFDGFLTRTLREINKKEHKVASVLFDYISNISTIITLKLEKLAKREYLKRINKVFPIFRRNSVVNEVKWFVVSMLMSFSVFFVILLYVYRMYTLDGVVMVGTMVMLYEYMNKFTNVFFGFAWKYEKLVMDSTNMATVDDILKDYEELYSKKGVRQVNKNWKKISIRELFFKYEDQKHHVHTLKDISLDLEKGKKIALVGASGSGKSTLMSIMRGLTFTDHIKMLVDGKEYNDLRALSETTTLIPQDPEIFENTIEYNITMGISHEKRELRKVVKAACFDKVVAQLPLGLDTDIREKGVNLSGGEKQRLALSRGIFAGEDSSIILLDEPTSSVDSTNELKIYKNLFVKFKDKCLISSVHGLHLLKFFDHIYVFEKGEIVENGTYGSLLKKGRRLTEMLKDYDKD
jgi:ABC-type multidrug transport system fused ATPase/permease subunit